ncbi:reverse transcriptase domain-containing protein [Tanacetum coccineum]
MSAMANLTPIVTTVTKTANKEKASDAAPRVNILDFCEEHYEDILPIIMEKARHDKRKEVQTRLNFGENSKKTRRERESSLNSRPENSPTRLHPGKSRTRGRERRDDRNVFNRLSHRRKSVHERLSDTYSPSTKKSGPSRDRSRDKDRGRSVKRWRDSESPSSRGSESSTSNGGHWKLKTKRRKRVEEDDLAIPWTWAARVWFDELPPESIDGYKGLKTAFLAYFMQQKKYVKDPVEIHNIKQRDGETIEDFMERFKVETGLMKGAPKCMLISGFMHGVNNPELTKRLNEHVPKTMEEMMTVTTAFIRGEAAAASKKKGHSPWKSQDQSKRHASERKSDFRGQSREGRGSNSNKFYDFHNDKGHNTDECMRLKKQIEELVRAGKLSHLIKEIKQGRDQTKNGKKEAPAKDKSLVIYMIQPWQRTTKQKLTQSFAYGSKITFPPLASSDGTEGPLVIEAEIGGHMIHRMYIEGGSFMEVLYEHCFNQIRSISPYNGIIGRPGIREIQAVPSTAYGMLKFPADGGIVTIRSTILILAECTTVITSPKEIPKEAGVRHESIKTPEEKPRCIRVAPSDMTGVPRSVAEHRLNIQEGYSPVRQKKRGQAPERAKAIQAEVQKLAEVGIMREFYYHDWLSNHVMVKKHDDSWQICVDFTDLNKACLQDCYPLPEIDWKIKSLCGYPFKCFLDAYKGYHQIQMAEADEEKTAFHTSQGVYCYIKMPFGLKNAGATYQRLVDKAFDSQVGRNIEVYVDDLVIKSHTEAEMLRDIEETFRTLRKTNMKLNPKKCTFGVVEGIFLGYTITPEGIKPCPNKTEVVLQLPSPRTIKEVQSLNGKLASLNKFLSKSAEKSLPLFKTLKKCIKKSDFHWTPEAEQAFKQLKQHLSELPLLVAPKPKEELIIYLSASYGAIISRLDVAGRLQKWSVMLGEHNITYRPRTSVKGQILADFLVEKPDENPPDTSAVETPPEPWTLFTYGSSCVDGSGAGLILTNPEGTEFTYALRFQFTASNNEAEYEALIAGLRIAAQMGVRNVQVSVDSKLVANQVLETYVAKEENMIKYLEKVKSLVSGFANFSISQVSRSKNKKADALSKIASTSFAHLSKQVLVEAHRTMIKSSHGDTLFSLTYGTEAVIPVKIRMPTYRTVAVDTIHNDEELRLNLYLLEEKRERAAICEAKAKMKMTMYYNARVRGVAFKPGDFIYRSNYASHAAAGGKLGPKWEGPYEVTEVVGDGTYRLRTMEGANLPRTWNIANLKKCYL